MAAKCSWKGIMMIGFRVKKEELEKKPSEAQFPTEDKDTVIDKLETKQPIIDKAEPKDQEESCWTKVVKFYSKTPIISLFSGRPIKFKHEEVVETQRGK